MTRVTILLLTGLVAVLGGCTSQTDTAGGSGLIETDETIVSAETSGRVLELRFDEGTTVQTGDILALIDPSRTELEIASARAGLRVLETQLTTARIGLEQAVTTESFAASEFARIEELIRTGSATDRQHDQAEFEKSQAAIGRAAAESQITSLEAQIEKAENDIARLERLMKDHYPFAPVNGIITEKYVETGELLSPGRPIARISSIDTVFVKVYLPSAQFAEVRLGDPARVDTETSEITLTGTVVWTSDEAEFTPKNVQTEQARADLVYAVKVRVANPNRNLKAGMPVFVTLEP